MHLDHCSLCGKWNIDLTNYAWALGPDEEVGCYFCMQNGNHTTYKRGEAYLCGSEHTPCNGNANYVCERHLDKDAVKVDLHQGDSHGQLELDKAEA